MIPLLARVLSAVLASHQEGSAVLVTDPGRFDPEIVSLIADLEAAGVIIAPSSHLVGSTMRDALTKRAA